MNLRRCCAMQGTYNTERPFIMHREAIAALWAAVSNPRPHRRKIVAFGGHRRGVPHAVVDVTDFEFPMGVAVERAVLLEGLILERLQGRAVAHQRIEHGVVAGAMLQTIDQGSRLQQNLRCGVDEAAEYDVTFDIEIGERLSSLFDDGLEHRRGLGRTALVSGTVEQLLLFQRDALFAHRRHEVLIQPDVTREPYGGVGLPSVFFA